MSQESSLKSHIFFLLGYMIVFQMRKEYCKKIVILGPTHFGVLEDGSLPGNDVTKSAATAVTNEVPTSGFSGSSSNTSITPSLSMSLRHGYSCLHSLGSCEIKCISCKTQTKSDPKSDQVVIRVKSVICEV